MDLTCPTCASTFEKRTYQQRYCSDLCRSKGKAAAQKAARHARRATTCAYCGGDILGRTANARYCSDEHARLGYQPDLDAKPRCAIAECDDPAVARGWCPHHWYSWREHGDPLTAPRLGPRLPLADRLWAGVDTIGECWVWTRAVNESGYGKIADGGNGPRGTHVVSWELANGPISDGLWVLHHCDNPPCVRPDHLFLGTAWDNNHDMIAKGRAFWQRGGSA